MKKIITYSTPKRILAERKRQHTSVPSKKDKSYCRKLRGAHEYTIKEPYIIFGKTLWITNRCRGCGKKGKIDFTNPTPWK